MSMKQPWWGYLHTNGSVQVKRYFEPLDIQEAWESPFVQRATGAFEAYDREDAMAQATAILKPSENDSQTEQ